MFGPQIRRVKLEKQSELRIKEQRTSPLRLRLLDGRAEIFGYELPHEAWITFPPLMTFAVFTWYGATIEIDGISENDYISCETPMVNYLEVHNSLQVQRHRVTCSTRDSVSSQGPRVVIVGDKDSGKSTLAKMLLNWAAKDGWKPTFVDLNIGQNSITIPGTVSATPIRMPVDPVEGFPLDKALVHYFGHANPNVNLRLYKTLVEELARELKEEFSGSAESRASGMVIDTMGFIVREGYTLLLHAIRTFNASLVIVLGQEEKLVNDLKKDLKFKKNLQFLNLEKSAGVFSRSSDFRKTLRNSNIQNYFYGVTNDLTVYTKTVKFTDVQVYQIGDFRESSSTSAHQRLLLHAIRTFNASLVIVLGQEEKLVNDLKKDLKFKKNLQFLNLEKSAGVFSRSSDFRKTLRNSNIQNYFYGVTNDLTVYTKTVKFTDVQVYQIGDFRESSSTSAHQRGNNPLKIIPVTIDEHLVNKVLAISYAKQPHQIISSIVAGFVCIKNVDIVEERITYISPSAAELPSKTLIMGTLTWRVT